MGHIAKQIENVFIDLRIVFNREQTLTKSLQIEIMIQGKMLKARRTVLKHDLQTKEPCHYSEIPEFY